MNELTRGLRVLRAVAWALSGLVLFLAIATLRALTDGEREMLRSDIAFDAGDLHAAMQHARRAASSYAPGAPHVERAFARLDAIARGAEARGNADLALQSFQAQRAAVLESASLFGIHAKRLELANRNLARLSAARLSGEEDRVRASERLFQQAQQARPGASAWAALLPLGLLTAAAALAYFAAAGFDSSGRVRRNRAFWALAAFAMGAALWAVGAFRG